MKKYPLFKLKISYSQLNGMKMPEFNEMIHEYFSRTEIIELFTELAFDFEDAPSLSKRFALIPELIRSCRENGKLGDLLQICNQERDFADWPTLAELTVMENKNLLAHPHLPVYKTWVVKQYNVMRLLSMARPLSLDAVYTDVYLLDKDQNTRDDQKNARLDAFSRRERGLQGKRYSGVEMLAQEKHLFIVGQPGAGKTTFLKWLAVRSAQDELSLKKTPILVELRRLNDGQYTLFELIVKEWLHSGFPKALAEDYLELLIGSGNALILLDGLDEIKQELRERVNNQIDDLVRMSGKSHVIISCRLHAEARQFKTFIYMEMAEFTLKQVNRFVKNWFYNEEEKASRLIQELDETEQKPIQELTRTPLLLALICITYDYTQKLPVKRSELYEQALDIVLSRWDNERGIRRESTYRRFSLGIKEDLLAYIAYFTLKTGKLFFPEKELAELIEEFWEIWRKTEISQQEEEYGQVYPPDLPERNIDALQIIFEITTQHGIFVEQSKGIYSFAHLSFQEYFMARYITRNLPHGTLGQLMNHVEDDQWREIFLLTASLLKDADHFFSLFLERLDEMCLRAILIQQLLSWVNSKVYRVTDKKTLTYRSSSLSIWYLNVAVLYGRSLVHTQSIRHDRAKRKSNTKARARDVGGRAK